MNKETQS